MTKWSAAAALLLSFSPRLARADAPEKPDDPPPHEKRGPLPPPRAIYQPRPAPPPSTSIEPGVILGQVVLAGAIPIVAVTQLPSDVASRPGLVILAATPLVVGTVVCAVGAASTHRRGSCLTSIGGAYLGAASTVPLFLLGYGLDSLTHPQSDSDVNLPIFGIMFGITGWFAVQPAASVAAWLVFSHQRPGLDVPTINPPPLPPPARSAFAPDRPRRLAMAPGQVDLPLLSLGF